jgi:hypothetical protein
LNGISHLSAWYSNDKLASSGNVDHRWSAKIVELWMSKPEIYSISGYANGAGSIYSHLFYICTRLLACVKTAFERYRKRIEGRRGLVVGSINPWIEVLALQNGAKSMLTAEYRRIVPGDSRLEYVHPIEMAKNWTRFSSFGRKSRRW